jgi:endonuclease/exonuclease/phosphatase family metal-dependent hydrolase
MGFFRKTTKYTIWAINIIVAIMLLCALLIPVLNVSTYWPIGLLGLVTPYLAAINILYIIFWMLLGKNRRMLLSIIVIVLSWKIFSVGIAGNIAGNNNMLPKEKTLKVMSYNVRLLDLYKNSGEKQTRNKLLQFIKEKKADVLCMQEFYSSLDSSGIENIKDICDSCNYRFVATNKNYITKRGFFGDIIFSKLPIIAQENLLLDTAINTHHFQYADVVKNKDTFRIFNLHLQSIKLSQRDYNFTNISATPNDELIDKGKTILYKLKKSFSKRGNQANVVAQEIQESPYANIVCGDFNDIPSSYSYFKIRGNMNDAFLQKGFGLGATYNGISPVLRIDNIFYSNAKFETIGFEKCKVSYSDHYPIIANLLIK